jgi:probable HAF family extracellular repeat protein
MSKLLPSAIACIAPLLAFAAHAQQYTVTDLGTLGGASSSGVALNNNGQVIGTSTTSSGATDAFLYSNGTMTDIGNWTPSAINDAGQIVGTNSQNQAVIYSAGNLSQIPLTGYAASTATGINNSGQVVGIAGPALSGPGNVMGDTYIYNTQTGSTQIITPAIAALQPPDDPFGTVYTVLNVAINASGQIAGTAEIYDSSNAYFYNNGAVQILGPGLQYLTHATGINAAGVVTYNSGPYAFLFVSSTGTGGYFLNPFTGGGAGDTNANGINDLGQVVGETQFQPNGPFHAFRYDTGNQWVNSGQFVDLNSEIGSAAALFTLVSAQSINNSGQILVDGYVNATGQDVAFLLTPLPLPASGWLLLAGIGALGAVARRKRV